MASLELIEGEQYMELVNDDAQSSFIENILNWRKKYYLIPWWMESCVGGASVLLTRIQMKPWKDGKIGCMNYPAEGARE